MSPSSSATSTMRLSFLTRGTGSVWGISQPFGWLSPAQRQITHVLLTRSPLYYSEESLVRLACVRRAASVRSEPGSNSQKLYFFHKGHHFNTLLLCRLVRLCNCQRTTKQGNGRKYWSVRWMSRVFSRIFVRSVFFCHGTRMEAQNRLPRRRFVSPNTVRADGAD